MRHMIWPALIGIFLIASCAGKSVKEIALSECVSDPPNGGFQCSDGQKSWLVAYKDTGKTPDHGPFVAHTMEEDQAFWQACILQRKGAK
jgi:hypothetical protein